ncbi:RsfS/YbeB/iojap family protein, partial [bacterium]|nr:RsfS/YbeB/iojap family protein [bacterium]
VEGYQSPYWILIDCFNVVLHVFQPETRDYYALEKFWGDAPREEFPDG